MAALDYFRPYLDYFRPYLDTLDKAALTRLVKNKLHPSPGWGKAEYGCLVTVARGVRREGVGYVEDLVGYNRDARETYLSPWGVPCWIGTLYDRLIQEHPTTLPREIQNYARQRLATLKAEEFLRQVESNRPAVREPSMLKRVAAVALVLLVALVV